MDEWFTVYSLTGGYFSPVAKFKHLDDANDYLRMTLDSGYTSYQGRVVESKNIEAANV